MKQKDYEKMLATGVAPCGCPVEFSNKHPQTGEWLTRSCQHREGCRHYHEHKPEA